MKYLLFYLIKLYQFTISPDHSIFGRYFFPQGRCKFYPSCSEHTKQEIYKYGALKGSWRGVKQISKCF